LSRRTLKLWIAALVATAAAALFAAGAPAGVLYANNYNEKTLAALGIGADGLLTPLTGSPFATPFFAEEFAITPDGRTMVESYGFDAHVGVLTISPSGVPATAGTPLSDQAYGYPAITPDGRFAYVPRLAGGVFAYAIGADGNLTRIGNGFGSGEMEMPAITPDGRFVLLPNYGGSTIERLAIQPDGTLQPAGTSPAGTPNPLALQVTPNGKFAVLLGSPTFGENRILSLAIGADGSLTPTGPPLETNGDASGNPVIAPNGRYVYLADGNEATVSAYSIEGNGVLSKIGAPTPVGFSQPEAIGISVDGRHLYVEQSSGHGIQAFSIAADGGLTKTGPLADTGGDSDGTSLVPWPAVPTATLGPVPQVTPGKKATFSASSSDRGAAITGFSWNFGDGTTPSNTASPVQHTFKKPGIYTVTVTANDDAGCAGFVFTGQSAYCNGRNAQASVTVDTLPVIQGIVATPTEFAAASISAKKKKGPKPGTTFHYKLSEKARVTFAIQRKLKGHRAGKSCKPKPAKGTQKKCTLLKRVGSFGASGKKGKNKKRFSGKLKGRRLPPGAYRATATAVDSAGGKSAPRSTGFRVTAPRPRR